jgi:hypothetical protein
MGLEDAPLTIDTTEVTSAEKRRLVELMRNQQPGRLNGVATKRLRLAERDFNFLIAWGLSLGSPRTKAGVQLGEGTGHLLTSTELPAVWPGASYFNLQGTARCEVQGGKLGLRFEKVQVGGVGLPRFVLSVLSPFVVSTVVSDPDLGGILASVESLTIEPGVLDLHYREGTFRDVAALLERAGAKPNVLTSTRAQILHLLHMKDQFPKKDGRFGALLETSFALARMRSQGGSPANENRAAIYALGVLAGHHRFADLIGLDLEDSLKSRVWRGMGSVTLRGRSDWPRHYFLSAAIAQLSAESVSDAMGLLKEELDVDKGGSGFSFSDLLADRAGTMFSVAATRDEQTALAMQERLRAGFRVDDFFPKAADLPEGITDLELQEKYGGVGGEAYRRLVEDVERRLSSCAALR